MASPHPRSFDCSSEYHPIRNEFKIDEQKTKEKKKRYENAIPFLFFPSAGATLDDLRSLKMPVVLMQQVPAARFYEGFENAELVKPYLERKLDLRWQHRVSKLERERLEENKWQFGNKNDTGTPQKKKVMRRSMNERDEKAQMNNQGTLGVLKWKIRCVLGVVRAGDIFSHIT